MRAVPGMAAALAASLCLWGQAAKTPAKAPAAPNPAADSESGDVFRVNTRVVDLNATVIDHSGHLVTNLPREAFTVYENGAAQQIRAFKREDVPVSLGLIIDNSSSMRHKLAQVESAALALVKDSNPQDEVFIVNFDDEPHLDLPHGKDFTSDIKEMEEALARIDPRGGTAMRDAIQMAIVHLKKAHRDKKVLVVITDGNDNFSTISLENLVKAAQQSGVLIYSVGLLAEEEHGEARSAEKALDALAVATGGETFFPKEVTEVEPIAHQVAHGIRSQYSIVYSPANQSMDGTYRKIRVAAKGPGGPTVRTRSGYYATPDQGVVPRAGLN